MLQLERIERRVLGERQAMLQALAMWGGDVDLPSVQEAWDEFDEALATSTEPKKPMDSDREDMLRALGILP